MKTKQIEVYTYDDLIANDDLKEKVLDKFRITEQETGYLWGSDNDKTLSKFQDIFPIKVMEYDYSGYGNNYIDFIFTDKDEIAELSGIRLSKYIWNNYADKLFKGKYKSVDSDKPIKHNRVKTKKLSNGKLFHAYYSAITLDNSCVLTGYCIDDDILKPIYDFLKKPTEISFYDLLEDCLNSWLKSCSQDYEYCLSDEHLLELIQINDYEFDLNGNLI